MDNRTRAGISNIVIGVLITAFFVFGLGLFRLVPVLAADPAKGLAVLSQSSGPEILLLGVAAVLFLFGLFTICRGISMLLGLRLWEGLRVFMRDVRGATRDTDRPDTPEGGVGKG